MKHDKLDTFMLVLGGAIISPALTTTREYGAWFTSTFDNYTAKQELYCVAKTNDGTSVMESHPGTRIGKYFDTHEFQGLDFKCWYIKSDSKAFKQIVKRGLAENVDCISHKDYGRVLRVYTTRQIQLYLRSTIDANIDIGSMVLTTKKILVGGEADYIMPYHRPKRKRLF